MCIPIQTKVTPPPPDSRDDKIIHYWSQMGTIRNRNNFGNAMAATVSGTMNKTSSDARSMRAQMQWSRAGDGARLIQRVWRQLGPCAVQWAPPQWDETRVHMALWCSPTTVGSTVTLAGRRRNGGNQLLAVTMAVERAGAGLCVCVCVCVGGVIIFLVALQRGLPPLIKPAHRHHQTAVSLNASKRRWRRAHWTADGIGTACPTSGLVFMMHFEKRKRGRGKSCLGVFLGGIYFSLHIYYLFWSFEAG